MDQEKPVKPSLASRLFPATPQTVLQYREMDQEEFLENIDLDVAQRIVDEWRAANISVDAPQATQKTQNAYQGNHVRLCHMYAKELGIEVDAIDPVQIVRQFFLHATKLSSASWKIYRFSLRHIFNQQAEILQKQNRPHGKLLRALAALITYNKKHHDDARGEEYAGKQVRVKSIGLDHFERLLDELANGPEATSIRVQRTQAFAIATIATGMRPGEWLDTIIRDATEMDFVDGTNPEGWTALVINTSKRKQTEVPWVRTILIQPGHYQVHIHQHVRMVKHFLEKTNGTYPFETQYIQKCTSTLTKAARRLWPKNPERWITLYSLRSQARANLVSVHGADIGAAMLGHSPEKSSRFYAGSHRANLPRGGAGAFMLPKPGIDCLVKAGEFALRMESAETAPSESEAAPSEAPAP